MILTSGFPLTWMQKFPGLFQDPVNIFPGPCRMRAMFKYKDKQQFLWGPRSRAKLWPPAIFSYIQIKSELMFANFGICICIIVSAYHLPPGLSRRCGNPVMCVIHQVLWYCCLGKRKGMAYKNVHQLYSKVLPVHQPGVASMLVKQKLKQGMHDPGTLLSAGKIKSVAS